MKKLEISGKLKSKYFSDGSVSTYLNEIEIADILKNSDLKTFGLGKHNFDYDNIKDYGNVKIIIEQE